MHQRLTGLGDLDFDALRQLAGDTVAAQEAASRESGPLIRGAASVEERQRAAPELLRLRTEAEAVERNSMEALRARLGPERFAQLDRRVREHVVPHLKLYPVTPRSQNNPPGGD
jgi:hypothetical protein